MVYLKRFSQVSELTVGSTLCLSSWTLVQYLGSSSHTKVNHGLPKGSLLGQILFTLYMVHLGSIIKRPSILLFFLCMILIFIYSRWHTPIVKLQESPNDIKNIWMTSNFLFLNSDKTGVIVLCSKNVTNMVSNQILALDEITLASSNTVRNLGVNFWPGVKIKIILLTCWIIKSSVILKTS